MKKVLLGFLITLCGNAMFLQGKTEYKHLSELPADSLIRNSCENVDGFSFLTRGSVISACSSLNETFAQLDDLFARKDEFKPEDILAKKQEIRTLAIPIFIFESQDVRNKEKEIIREYMKKRFGSEIVDEMEKYSSSQQK